jgi:hypothetical protein
MSHTPGESSASNELHVSPDEDQAVARVEVLRRKELVDKINYVNFLGRSLAAVFGHATYGSELAVPVVPQPCSGSTLDCTWQAGSAAPGGGFTLQRLEIQERDGTVHIVPEEFRVGDLGISVSLPEESSIVVPVATVRYEARDVEVYLIQNGIRLRFELVDYSVGDFRVRATDTDAFGYDLLNSDDEVTLLIENDGRTVYSSRCVLATAPGPVGGRFTTLIPRESETPRFPPLEYRSGRHTIENAPVVYLRNPLSKIEMSYVVSEISGTGFAVEETERDSRLIPGLIIFDAQMIFPDRKAITLTIQVVHRQPSTTPILRPLRHRDPRYQCGGSSVDHVAPPAERRGGLIPQRHAQPGRSLAILLRVRLHLSREVRVRFGDQGRTSQYLPEAVLPPQRCGSSLCRPADHRILGHLSMVRFYEKAWLIQHHASVAREGRAAGLRVLNQVGRYASEAHRFRSMNLRFLMAYYRPENRFPARVFGGLAPFVDDPQECSVDAFALTHFDTDSRGDAVLPGLYSIGEMTENDFRCLDHFYSRSSGGMLLEAMHIPPYAIGTDSESEIEAAFRLIGLQRSRKVLALRKNDELVAAMVVNRSDVGINLSELTNSITFLVIDHAALPRSVFDVVCREVARTHATSSVPVLVYPREVAEALGIDVDRVYNLWIMRTTIGDKYFKHLNGFVRHVES